MREVATADILQFDALEQVPDAFIRVQLWCIGWQVYQQESLGCPLGQEGLDLLGSMDGCAIPNHQEFPGDLAQEQPQEPHDIFGPIGPTCTCITRRPPGVMPLMAAR